MTADLTTLLTVYHKQIKAGQYDTVEESINKVTEAAYKYIFIHYLKQEEQLKKIRRGSFFSTFNAGEIKFISAIDKEIAAYMDDLWILDNDYCMHLDFLDEDYESYDYASAEEYQTSLDNHYTLDKLENLDRLNKYVTEAYGPVAIILPEPKNAP